MRIDSHHHFWGYSQPEYTWGPKGSPLQRDYGPMDLEPLLRSTGIAGCISVQARQDLRENHYLCTLAAKHSFILGVVGWIDLRSSSVESQAAEFALMPKAVGVRHVVQDETDPQFMSRPEFRRGIACLRKHRLVYDILIFEHQLGDAIRLVRDLPEQVFVLDHIAKPKIRKGEIGTWSSLMTEIAHYSNCYVKLSGVVTEADHQAWNESQLIPFLDATAAAFGPERIMFGSDWPVIRLACEYGRWVEIVEKWASQFDSAKQEQIWGGTAKAVYLHR